MKTPLSTGHCRMIEKSAVVPCTWVLQLASPATTWASVRTPGATASTAGHSRLIASASSGLSVVMLPMPPRAPLAVIVPGITVRVLAPSERICACTAARAPWPIASVAITAATPITMPSTVSAARRRLRVSALSPSPTRAAKLIAGLRRPARRLARRRVRRTGRPCRAEAGGWRRLR